MLRRRLMKQQEDEVIDLSLRDVYGNPIERSTANCYVISKPGKYKFPLVYGNAVKNGKVNFAAFTNNGGEHSHDFVDGSGHIIDAPTYILGFGNRLTVSNYDEEGLIEYDESNGFWSAEDGEEGYTYACFTIGHIPSTGANILVSVTDYKNEHIEWTWHLWLWPHDLSPVSFTGGSGTVFNILPVNLASKYDSDMIHMRCWYYQFGRKDPILPFKSWDSAENNELGFFKTEYKAENISDAIQKPDTFFIYPDMSAGIGYISNWFSDTYYVNLWNSAKTYASENVKSLIKTVYDPCPFGWKVPDSDFLYGLNYIGDKDGYVISQRFEGDTIGVAFPLGTSRYYGDGESSLQEETIIWSSDVIYASGGFNAAIRYASHGGFVGFYTQQANGGWIRPVEDDLTKIDEL